MNQIKKISPVLRKSLGNIFSEEVESKEQQLKTTFQCAVAVAHNYLGRPAAPFTTTSEQLCYFVPELFEELDAEEKQAIKKKCLESQNKENIKIQVKTEITEATVAVDQTNKEYAYVFSKLRITENNVECTPMIFRADRIQWDETFILDVNDYENDRINVEFWVSKTPDINGGEGEEKHNKKTHRKSNLGKMVKNLKRLNIRTPQNGNVRLVGVASIRVMNLPSIPTELNLDLIPPTTTGKTKKSQVKLTVELCTRKNYSHDYHLNLHTILLKHCYERQISTVRSFNLWTNWMEILPIPALTLLHQHAIQYSLTTTEQTLCSWIVSASLKMNMERRISYVLLRSLLEDLRELAEFDPLDNHLMDIYQRSYEKFIAFTSEQLSELHRNFDWHNKQEVDELFELLRCVVVGELEGLDTTDSFHQTLEEECEKYYVEVIEESSEELEDKSNVTSAADAIKDVVKEIIMNQIYLDDVFGRAWNLQYTKLALNSLNNTVEKVIKPTIKELAKKSEKYTVEYNKTELLKLLQVYHTFRNLVEYLETKLPEDKTTLTMSNYPDWFGEKLILQWFVLSTKQAGPFIQKAVEYDRMEPIDEFLKYGTSTPDVINIIDEMVIVIWFKMQWEDQFYTHTALVEAINSCAVEYIKTISERILDANYFYGNLQFAVTQRLCVALSSAFALYEYMHTIENKIRKVTNEAEKIFAFAFVDQSELVQNELLQAISGVYHMVMKKIKLRLDQICTHMVSVEEEKAQRKAVNGLCIYAEDTLEIMYNHLNPLPFGIMLRALWLAVVEALLEKTKRSWFSFLPCKLKPPEQPQTISLALTQLQSIFYCKGKGLTHYEMQNKKFKQLSELMEENENRAESQE